MSVIEHRTNPLSQFLYALKAPETKRQWPNRLKVVFDYLGFPGTLDEQAKQFMRLCREEGTVPVQDKIIGFISYQVQRAQKGEISLSTIPNYLKAMKLFCEMNDIYVSWKKNSRGVPRGRPAANDRAPTKEEILRLLEYPDRRIKPIVYTMVSSGIRIGAWDSLKWKHVKQMHNENGEVVAAKLTIYPCIDRYIARLGLFKSVGRFGTKTSRSAGGSGDGSVFDNSLGRRTSAPA